MIVEILHAKSRDNAPG